MPRFPVYIDLTYLPLDYREDALRNIQSGLERIKNAIEKAIIGLRVTAVSLKGESDVKLTRIIH